MKKLIIFEKFLPDSLLEKASRLSNLLPYGDTNSFKRSLSTGDINKLSPDFAKEYNAFVKKKCSLDFNESTTHFYKRKNSVVNPHVDGCKFNLLVYLSGISELSNGTFFLNDDKSKIKLLLADVPNLAVLFDGTIYHGSYQAAGEISAWRSSLNTFIWS
jgi:hypothetical protein